MIGDALSALLPIGATTCARCLQKIVLAEVNIQVFELTGDVLCDFCAEMALTYDRLAEEN